MADASPPTPPRLGILVVGAGAVGGYYGGMLARAGHDVTFVARGENGRVLRERGLEITTPHDAFTLHPKVLDDVRGADGLRADVVLVCVKAPALAEVAPFVGRALGPDGVAVPLLNGLDSEAELAAVIGARHVVGGVAQIAAWLVAPGRIRVDGPARIVLAPFGSAPFAPVRALSEALRSPGFECEARKDLSRVLWNKLLWNSPFNGICALTRRNAGEVLAVPELESLVRRAMQEVASVAATEGVEIDAQNVEKTIEWTRAHYAATVPSMLQDVLAARPTEVRTLQGAVLARGRRRGIPVPIHETLHALLLGLEHAGS